MAEKIRREDELNTAEAMLPVYRQLSLKNGKINKMTKEDLRAKLSQLNLETRGVKEVLKKRLKNFYKKRELMKAKIRPSADVIVKYDYFAVIDFEATCQEHNPQSFKHEIIEFPVVLVDTKERKIVNEFQAYVKPVLNPTLTSFCTELTGITQKQVSRSDRFPAVLEKVEEWMKSLELGKKGQKFAVLTDGPWDMARFLHIQCLISQIPFPKWARKWINIRKSFSNFYGFPRSKLTVMLEYMGMSFEGHQHSGIDDARNIAKIAIRMLGDGCSVQVNERIYAEKLAKHSLDLVDIECIKKDSEELANSSSDEDCDIYCKQRGDYSKESVDINGARDALLAMNMKEKKEEMNNYTEEQYDDLLSYYALQNS